MRRLMPVLLLASLLMTTAGCSRIPGGVAPSTIPLEQGGYTIIGPTAGSDCKVNLLGLIPVSGGNSVREAIDEARNKQKADALIDISIDAVSKFFILWSETCTEVHATAVWVK